MRLARLERLAHLADALPAPDALVRRCGTVVSVSANLCRVQGFGPSARIGTLAAVPGHRRPLGEVVALADDVATIALYRSSASLAVGDLVHPDLDDELAASADWLGRTVDAFGYPVDGRGPLRIVRSQARMEAADRVPSMERVRVGTPFATGVRAIDAFTPLCFGQRIGIFAGSGVGKSTLLGMLAGASAFDAVVIALVGERNREVGEFIGSVEEAGAAGKCLFVIATADESPAVQRRAPGLAMRVAEAMRARGLRILLLLDSVTRFAHADRQVAISLGELPVARGYPASTLSAMSGLLERAGAGSAGQGSVTLIATVLVDGDDHNEPVADVVRGTLDGHVVLDRDIAQSGRFPAMDLRASISRLADRVWSRDQREVVRQLRGLVTRYEDTRDLRLLGAWTRGADPELDRAVDLVPALYDVLRQAPDDPPATDPFADIAQALRIADANRRSAAGAAS